MCGDLKKKNAYSPSRSGYVSWELGGGDFKPLFVSRLYSVELLGDL
jgi:hypothetical protein